jgi:hypothetical protein
MKMHCATAVAAGALLLSPAATAPGSEGTGRSAARVVARDERGSVIQRSHGLWLATRRVGVAAGVYERLGIIVDRDRMAGGIVLAVPNSDVSYEFVPGRRRLTGQGANVRFTRPRLPNPVARRHHGEAYVAAAAVQGELGDLVQARWNRRARTLTLQRTKKLASIRPEKEKSPEQGPGLNARS